MNYISCIILLDIFLQKYHLRRNFFKKEFECLRNNTKVTHTQ